MDARPRFDRRRFGASSVAAAASLWLGGALGAVVAGSCRRDRDGGSAAPLLVFGAASLADLLAAIGEEYERATGTLVRCSFASSGQLARQILAGAPADVFVSADDVAMDDVEKAGKIAAGSRRAFASNRLAVIVPADAPDAPARPEDLPRVPRIVIGDPASVPAGRYARRWLQALGLWDAIGPRARLALDVRAVLSTVEVGGADAGIVYRSDALGSRRVRTAFGATGPSSPRIVYPAARLARSMHPARASFFAYLFGPAARDKLARYGFDPPPIE